jgi:hypothetical protein
MANKKILKVSLLGLIIITGIFLLASSLTAVTTSDTNACKESAHGCSQKNNTESKGDIDFETLSGKFFSSVSY